MAIDEQALAASIHGLTSTFRDYAGPPLQAASAHLAAVVAAAEDLLDADAVGIMLLDENGTLRAAASTSAITARLEQAQQRLGLGPGHDTIARRSTVLVENLTTDPAYTRLVAELTPLQVGAVLSAPIRVDGAVAGNLNLIRNTAHRWTESETRAAVAYAEVVGELLGASAQFGRARPARQPAADGSPDGTGGAEHAD
ncbi:MAG TPA: GAF domain-containing protein [Jatrophihabitans sp.]|nr:GAF domain-containing protein [Jatrophihabitans sp.]